MLTNAGYAVGLNPTIREGSYIYSGTIIGDNFSCGHFVLIREHTTIGNNCSVGSRSEIGHDCVIKDNVRIHSSCFVPEYTEIYEGAWLGPRVTICNVFHPLCPSAKECSKRTRIIIREGAIIGANVTILPGIEIGRDAIVGAGSIVTKNVPSNQVHFGNPNEKYTFRSMLKCHFDGPNPYQERLSIPPKENIEK